MQPRFLADLVYPGEAALTNTSSLVAYSPLLSTTGPRSTWELSSSQSCGSFLLEENHRGNEELNLFILGKFQNE